MKRIYVSQRVDIAESYNERRDALDQRWASFLRETGATPFPLPNNPESVLDILKAAPPDGFLLTGGNSPVRYGGNAPERDAVDTLLLGYAVKYKIPLIGVCRGMQSVLLHFGGHLREATSHVAVRHGISGRFNRTVNSYHTLAAEVVPSALVTLARSDDRFVEAVRHQSLPVLAIMWHPEREDVFLQEDADIFRAIWNGRTDTLL